MTPPPRLVRLALLLALCAACGVESPIPAARRELERGRLDRADEMLAKESDPEALAIRLKIRKMRAHREEARERLDDVAGTDNGIERGELLQMLRAMHAAEEDVVVRDWIEQELSRVADRAPARREAAPDAPEPVAVAPIVANARASDGAEGASSVDAEARAGANPEDTVGDSSVAEAEREASAREVEAREAKATEAAALVARAKELRGQLERASEAERDALHEELAALARKNLTAALELAGALEARWSAALPELTTGATLDELKALAARRTVLDEKRAVALARIRDEETYFYPFEPPAVSFEEVRRYSVAQRDVEQAVDAVRAIWEGTEAVELPPGFHAALREIQWLSEHESETRGPLALPGAVPGWILVQDGSLASIGIAELAWTPAEASTLRRSRAVRAYNERQWAAYGDGAGPEAPSEEERVEVRITNDYRALLGLPALAWNARLMVAARWHSDFMAKTGKMGHFEPEPARHSPFDRMSLAGYAEGAAENVHSGYVKAQLAHESWIQSSQHHRNLLNEDLQEMASARSGRFWTQDFGRDDAFLKDLDGWRH